MKHFFSKSLNISFLFLFLVVPAVSHAATLTVVSDSAAASYYNAVTKTADRLVALQNTDGGFDWIVTGATGPTGTTYLNVTGVTAQNLLSAYQVTGNATYLAAAIKAGDFIATTTDASSPAKINGYNLIYLKNLSTISGVTSYADKAASYFSIIYSATPTTICAAGCNDTNGLYAGYQAYRGWSTSTPNGVVAWDLASFVEYAQLTGDSTHAQELENVIVSNLSVATSTMDSYDLGIASGIKAASIIGDSTNASALKTLLSTTVAPYGTSADGQIQTTAYVLKALKQVGDSSMSSDAAQYLTSAFNSSFNGWTETDSTEYGEIDGEAASALALMLPTQVRYYTIQSAVDAATTSDTISVGAGAYIENVNVAKSLTILGPNASISGNGTRGSEAVVTGRFLVTASDTAIKGFTITNPSWNTTATIHGVQVWGGSSALSNETISNNIFTAIHNSTPKGSYGVMIQGAVTGAVVKNNKINDIQSAGWARGIEITPTSATTTVPQNVTVTDNVITNISASDAYAFSADEANASSTADASQITFNNNSFVGGKVKNSDIVNALDASRNFWGVNPDASRVLGNVVYSPYFTDATMTSLSSQTTTVGTTTSALFTSTSQSTGTTTAGTVIVTISASTTISGPSTWDGTFDLPTSTTTYTIPTESIGFWLTPTGAIEIGAGDVPLTFDQPVKLTFVGLAGSYVGWSQNGVFKKTSTVCDSATNPTLVAGTDCKIDVGADLVVWTKHATTFVTYTQSTIPYGGGGGSSSGSGSSVSSGLTGATGSVTSTASQQGQVLGASTSNTASQGQVLGVTAFNFIHSLGFGVRNNDVTELQKMLISNGHLKITQPTGYFGPLTKAALMKWQAANKVPSTGFFGTISRGLLNKGNQ